MKDGELKDMLEDIKNLASDEDFLGIIAICNNELESLEDITIKQKLISIERTISDIKYELTKNINEETNNIYEQLNEVSKLLRNLIIEKELSSSDQTDR